MVAAAEAALTEVGSSPQMEAPAPGESPIVTFQTGAALMRGALQVGTLGAAGLAGAAVASTFSLFAAGRVTILNGALVDFLMTGQSRAS
jgi:hypothetical protein